MSAQLSSTGPATPTQVDFYFDPTCPWTYRASLWIREARQVRPIEVTWKFLSLLELNRATAGENPRDTHLASYGAFPVLALARERAGNEAVDRLYRALGQARHERGEWLADPDVIERALVEADLDPAWRTEAAARPELEQQVLAEHHDAISRLRATAVPTISIDGQRAFFGPVITAVPSGEEAGEFWDHLSWLARRPDFFEYKKARD